MLFTGVGQKITEEGGNIMVGGIVLAVAIAMYVGAEITAEDMLNDK